MRKRVVIQEGGQNLSQMREGWTYPSKLQKSIKNLEDHRNVTENDRDIIIVGFTEINTDEK